jgi:hypothetical protein
MRAIQLKGIIMKTLYFLLTLISIGSSILIIACHKDGAKPNLSKYYPNDLGDSWVYDVVDSAKSTINNPSSPTHYTVNVTIVGTKKLADGKDASVWKYDYPSGTDTNYVRVSADTVKIYYNGYAGTVEALNYPSLIFVVPFAINSRWTGKIYGTDTSKVVAISNVASSTQTFQNVFKIYHHYIGPNTELNDYYFIKPNVGIVAENLMHYANGPITYRTWKLKSFTVH